jgi:hypothetical protein
MQSNSLKIVAVTLLLANAGIHHLAMAQMKVGSNPTTLATDANLQVEATDGKQVVVRKSTRLADSTLISASCSSDKPNSAGSLATPCANKTPGRRDKAPKMVDFLLFAIALLIKKFQVS